MSFKSMMYQAQFSVKQHSPELFLGAGIIGVVGSAVLACRATIKAEKVLGETKVKLEKCDEALNDDKISEEEYSVEDYRKDKTLIYTQTAAKLMKLYGPAFIVGALSIAGLLTSNKIMRSRNAALAAAYVTVDNAFKEYQKKVVDRFGQEVSDELKYGLKSEKVTEVKTDPDTGEETKVKTKKKFASDEISGYARFFEEYTFDENGNYIKNRKHDKNNEINMQMLVAEENYFNKILPIKGYIFLNEVYSALGLPNTKAGQVVGWHYDPKNPTGDNRISFGLRRDFRSYRDYVNGLEPAILLDFNVDGPILDVALKDVAPFSACRPIGD